MFLLCVHKKAWTHYCENDREGHGEKSKRRMEKQPEKNRAIVVQTCVAEQTIKIFAKRVTLTACYICI